MNEDEMKNRISMALKDPVLQHTRTDFLNSYSDILTDAGTAGALFLAEKHAWSELSRTL